MTHTLSRCSVSALLTASLLLCGLGAGRAAAQNVAPSVSASADTVTVQPGDTAYSLARRAGLSVETFLSINALSSPDLKVGQVVVVSATPPHTVQAGETLYAISKKYGVTVDALKAANLLPEDATIAVGQVLRIPAVGVTPQPQQAQPQQAVAQAAPTAPVVSGPAVTAASQPDNNDVLALPGVNWRQNALSMLGTPYVYGGTSRRGLDCSGFVLQVFTPLGVKLPRVSADQARVGTPVALNSLMPGDLLFFDTAGGGRVTHVGIYLGADTFINANSYRGQVAIDHLLSDKYWSQRYLSARRVLPEQLAMARP